jgi:predicted metalloprotease with PDZ domain
MLGLALDLQLRQKGQNLDDFMELVWETYGKPEIPYELEELENSLADYAERDFASNYFDNYIYDSKMPDFENLLSSVGLKIERDPRNAFFGASVKNNGEGLFISSNPQKNTPAYKAGLDIGDRIISINGKILDNEVSWKDEFGQYKPGNILEFEIDRYGNRTQKTVTLEADPTFEISIDEDASAEAVAAREEWLSGK